MTVRRQAEPASYRVTPALSNTMADMEKLASALGHIVT